MHLTEAYDADHASHETAMTEANARATSVTQQFQASEARCQALQQELEDVRSQLRDLQLKSAESSRVLQQHDGDAENALRNERTIAEKLRIEVNEKNTKLQALEHEVELAQRAQEAADKARRKFAEETAALEEELRITQERLDSVQNQLQEQHQHQTPPNADTETSFPSAGECQQQC